MCFWTYTNYGFLLLGVVIETVAKKTYYDYPFRARLVRELARSVELDVITERSQLEAVLVETRGRRCCRRRRCASADASRIVPVDI